MWAKDRLGWWVTSWPNPSGTLMRIHISYRLPIWLRQGSEPRSPYPLACGGPRPGPNYAKYLLISFFFLSPKINWHLLLEKGLAWKCKNAKNSANVFAYRGPYSSTHNILQIIWSGDTIEHFGIFRWSTSTFGHLYWVVWWPSGWDTAWFGK